MNKVIYLIKSEKFSDISQDIGQVFFAGLVIGPIVSGWNRLAVIAGLILSTGFWCLSLLIANK